MSQLMVFVPLGGGAGDCWWDWLHDPVFRKVGSLAVDYGARIRVHLQTHCPCTDIFTHNPHVRREDVIEEPWRLPNPEDAHRWNNPSADGFIPVSRNDLLHTWGVRSLRLQPNELHLAEEERALVLQLTARRPCVVAQPYAGLSDRDGFDSAALARLALDLHGLDRDVNLLVLGKNHDRGHKYAPELCPGDLPGTTNLIDQLGIRVAYHVVARCDAFVGAHSNLIRAAWDHRRRTALVVPAPLMTRHFEKLDAKYTYGLRHPENRVFTYPFDHGEERRFDLLDTGAIARFVLRGE